MSLKVTAYPLKATTSGSVGTAYVAFPAQPCEKLILSNPSAVAIDVKWNDVPQQVTIPALTPYYPIYGISNASQVSVRRNDVVATSVDVFGQALSV